MATDKLSAELDRIFQERDRENMAPTIAALRPILEQHPHDPRVLYEVGGAFDTAGEEVMAKGYYRRALGNGLHGDIRRRCFLQYGSTLRNLGDLTSQQRSSARLVRSSRTTWRWGRSRR